jgi:hypothetical protein
MSSGKDCSVVHSRGGNDKGRVIFGRSAAVKFIGWLKGVLEEQLVTEELGNSLAELKNREDKQDEMIQTLYHDGMEFGVPLFGIEATERAKWPQGDNRVWCKIEVKVGAMVEE